MNCVYDLTRINSHEQKRNKSAKTFFAKIFPDKRVFSFVLTGIVTIVVVAIVSIFY